MRHAGLWAFGVALLLLLGVGALVEGPDAAEVPPSPVPVSAAAILPSAEGQPQQTAAVTSRGWRADRHLAPGRGERVSLPAVRPVCDGNGYPLRAMSYVRTVYTVCRPEALAG